MNKYNSIIEREAYFIEQLNDKLPDLEYIEGYIWSESSVLLRCKKCNTTFYRCASIIRYPHYKKFKCNECMNRKKTRNKLKEKRLKEIERAKIKLSKATQIKLNIKECKECGELYIVSSHNKTYCSKECRDRACNRNHDRKRINKAKQNGVIDKSITLKKLAKRDNNICYLCNKKVDWNDYKIINDITICGDWYPSIEHVIPLCNGGTHTWENVKLAHRLCNTHKGKQILIPPGVSKN